jgi:hypothetical protein
MELFKLKMLSPKKVTLKLVMFKKIYGTNLLIFKTNKNFKGENYTFEIDLIKYKRLIQVTINISEITSFYKNGKEYYQQIYKNNIYHTEVILRFNQKMELKEIIYKF